MATKYLAAICTFILSFVKRHHPPLKQEIVLRLK
jgi:hypothetical protein